MPAWTWIAASQRGTAHAGGGERRQDAFRVLTAPPGFLIAAACDGAGSAALGGPGATLAARLLTNRAKAWVEASLALPSPHMIELWVAEARLALVVAADRLGCAPGAFATTLLLAISDGTTTITAHVGDGAAVARGASDGELLALSWPNSGEYASTTYFLTDQIPRLRIGVVEHWPIDRLALLTDGLERLALDFAKGEAHAPFFKRIFAAVQPGIATGLDRPLSHSLAAFLDSDAVTARTDDDKTLLLAGVG